PRTQARECIRKARPRLQSIDCEGEATALLRCCASSAGLDVNLVRRAGRAVAFALSEDADDRREAGSGRWFLLAGYEVVVSRRVDLVDVDRRRAWLCWRHGNRSGSGCG